MHHPHSVTRRVTIKNSIKAVLAAFALVGAAGTSQATTIYRDVDVLNETVSLGNSYFGTFNIVDPTAGVSFTHGGTTYATDGNYVPGTQLYSATALFFVKDDANDHWLAPLELGTFHLGLFGETEFVWALGSQTTVITLGASALSLYFDLQSNGRIAYTVSGLGDFRLEAAVLEVSGADRPTSGGPVAGVPDGGTTFVLMGLGLIGLVAVQTRLSRQAA